MFPRPSSPTLQMALAGASTGAGGGALRQLFASIRESLVWEGFFFFFPFLLVAVSRAAAGGSGGYGVAPRGPRVDGIKRERLVEGCRVRTMGGGVGGRM